MTSESASRPVADPTPWSLRSPRWSEDANAVTALLTALSDPARNPPMTNDWSKKPTVEHPEPVILIHGTFANAYLDWAGLAPILAAQGYCVYACNYGHTSGVPSMCGTGDMIEANREIAAFVAKVREATGSPSVALIGHSQGGAQARYYANLVAEPGEVSKVIMLTPTNHSTTLSGLTRLGDWLHITSVGFRVLDAIKMPAVVQQATPGCSFYRAVNGSGETRPGIDYTVIATRFDQVATPYTRCFIETGSGATADNILIQDVCGLDFSDHMSLPYSKNVAQIILNKLDPDHPHALRCYPQAAVMGTTRSLGKRSYRSRQVRMELVTGRSGPAVG